MSIKHFIHILISFFLEIVFLPFHEMLVVHKKAWRLALSLNDAVSCEKLNETSRINCNADTANNINIQIILCKYTQYLQSICQVLLYIN